MNRFPYFFLLSIFLLSGCINKKDKINSTLTTNLESSPYHPCTTSSPYNKEKDSFIAGFSKGNYSTQGLQHLTKNHHNIFQKLFQKLSILWTFWKKNKSFYESTYDKNGNKTIIHIPYIPLRISPVLSHGSRTYDPMAYGLFLPWEKGFFLLTPEGFLNCYDFSGKILWYIFLNDLSLCTDICEGSFFDSFYKKNYQPCQNTKCLEGALQNAQQNQKRKRKSFFKKNSFPLQKKEHLPILGQLSRTWKRFSNIKIDDGPGLCLLLGMYNNTQILYVLSGQGIIKALNPINGEKIWDSTQKQNSSIKTMGKEPWNGFIQSSLGAIQNHHNFYLCGISPKGQIVFLDGFTGKILWTHETFKEGVILQNRGTPIGFSEILTKESFHGDKSNSFSEVLTKESFHGDKSNSLTSHSGVFVIDFSGILHCFDKEGNILWHTSISDRTRNTKRYNSPYGFLTPSFSIDEKSCLLTTSNNGQLSCIDSKNGKILWHKDVGGADFSPILDKENIYLLSSEGILYVLDKKTGRYQWSITFDPKISWMGLYSLDELFYNQPENEPIIKFKKRIFSSFLKSKNKKKQIKDGRKNLKIIFNNLEKKKIKNKNISLILVSNSGDLFLISTENEKPEILSISLDKPLACPPFSFKGKLYCLTITGNLFALSAKLLLQMAKEK